MTMETIASIGAGTVGRSWAVVFARAGRRVQLWDPIKAALETSMAALETSVSDLHAAGLLDDPRTTLERINIAPSLEAALEDVDYVQESAPEKLSVKQALFAEMDALAPVDAVIGSSTSAIPGSAFLQDVPGRARCLVAHPVNPPHLIPLVEICPAPWTDPNAVARTRALMEAVGQAPVVLTEEVPGFLLNRLQWALLGEALHLVGEGYCTAEEIDRVLTQGLALRWAFAGPFEVGHLNASAGLAGYFSGLSEAMSRVQSSLRTDYRPTPELVAKLHAELAARHPVETLPNRQAWRDRRIMGLRRHLEDAEAHESKK
jgi:L-gulonate 3-dehydrogenase